MGLFGLPFAWKEAVLANNPLRDCFQYSHGSKTQDCTMSGEV